MNDYKKVVAAAVVGAGILFTSIFGSTSALAYSSGVVTGNGVRLRSNPNLSASILDHAYKGEQISIKEKQGSWYKVVLNGKEGWIYADYVKESSSNGTLASRSSANGVVIGRSVYVRKGAGASYSIITSLKRNASVKVLGKSSNGWYQVVLSNGVQGWMSGQYLKVSGTVSTISSSSTTSSRGSVSSVPGWVIANGGLSLRQEANTSSQRIKVIPNGSQVTIISDKNGWYQIKWGNYSGWAYAKYITKTKPASSKQTVSSRGDDNRELPLASQVVDFAKQQLGKAYRYGAEGPNAFDCSGLTYYVYKHFGYSIPRDSEGQGFGSYAPTVSKSDLKPGDIIVFSSSSGGYHIGLYIGDGKFIHSPNPGRTVSINSLSESWYKSHYIQAKRVLK